MSGDERQSTVEVRRDDLGAARVVEAPLPDLADGEALLRVERFGLSANNITYGALGDQLGYWRFFAASEDGWGRIPAWGFAEVVASASDELAVGRRAFGYVPMATHVVLRPGGTGARGFSDASPHRAELPKAYNIYSDPATDPAYRADREEALLLLRPLFSLSFLLDDLLGAPDATVIVTSASSKTSLGFARLQAERGVPVAALTSERHRAFVEGLGLYDRVATYDDVGALPVERSVLVDVAGNPAVRRAVHERLGEALARSILVGATHWDRLAAGGADPLPGPAPSFFFAPDQLRVRMKEWGPAGFGQRFAESFHRLVDWSEGWLEHERVHGAEAALDAYRAVAAGRVRPATGYVVQIT
jgi:NADPH:quinone reductase-like Zn-dependent oxidoreductase